MIACINVKSVLETVWLTFVLKVLGRQELGDHEGVGQDLRGVPIGQDLQGVPTILDRETG